MDGFRLVVHKLKSIFELFNRGTQDFFLVNQYVSALILNLFDGDELGYLIENTDNEEKGLIDGFNNHIATKWNYDLKEVLTLDKSIEEAGYFFENRAKIKSVNGQWGFIDEKGNIGQVRARAPHPRLEKEAARVINSLPKMKPGKQRGKPVGVMYSLPIAFKVQD